MLVDTHSHLHFAKYDADRAEVHARMNAFDVKTITVGTAMNTSRDAVGYADAHEDTWASVGYHPDHVTSDFEDEDEKGASHELFDIQKLEALTASSSRVLAIGECGLDYHYFAETPGLDIEKAKQEQLAVFNTQAELAARFHKALIVHSRDAGLDMVNAISDLRAKYPTMPMVIHGFSDTWRQAKALLDLDCYLGIGGIVTFRPRKTTAEEDILANIVKKMPTERLLIETDCPWLAPVPVRGGRNEPSYVRHVANFIAQIRGSASTDIYQLTTANAQACFCSDFTS